MEETGYDKGMQEVAKAMYQKKIPVDVISECTGLTIEKIQNILKEK